VNIYTRSILQKKCDYCSFYSVPLKDEVILEHYVSRLCDEISSCSDVFPSLADTIYFAEGLPLFKEEHLKKLFLQLKIALNYQRVQK
jgi:coproporphyrinogen III oxidase-like Fe-S oxidoreductase